MMQESSEDLQEKCLALYKLNTELLEKLQKLQVLRNFNLRYTRNCADCGTRSASANILFHHFTLEFCKDKSVSRLRKQRITPTLLQGFPIGSSISHTAKAIPFLAQHPLATQLLRSFLTTLENEAVELGEIHGRYLHCVQCGLVNEAGEYATCATIPGLQKMDEGVEQEIYLHFLSAPNTELHFTCIDP